MAAPKQVRLGTIKLVDPKKGLGVIAPRPGEGDEAEPADVIFQMRDVKRNVAWRLREGQLVQFVMADNPDIGPVATEVEVLSNIGYSSQY